MKKIHRLKFFKLTDITRFSDALSEDWQSTPGVPLSQKCGLEGMAYRFPSKSHEPEWAAFYNSALESPEHFTNQTSSALIVVKIDDNYFAIPYGYGGTKIDPIRIESRFGLKCALNRMDVDGVKGLDTRTLEEESLFCRKQRSRATKASNFKIETNVDLLKGIRGDAREGNLKVRLAGADALELVRGEPFDITEIATIFAEYLSASREKTYLQIYPWVDKILDVSDRRTLQELDDLLLADLLSGSPEAYLAEPTIIEFSESLEFSYKRVRVPTYYPHLEIRDFLASLPANVALTLEKLKRAKIFVRGANDSEPREMWLIYDALVLEIDHGGKKFLLNGGKWYEVATDFVTEVRNYLRHNVERPALLLPVAGWDEDEDEYNKRVSSNNNSLILMDRVLDKPTGAGSEIEAADLIGRNGQLIHVKFKSGSGTLSHLFHQGTVAAEVLMHDKVYRDKVVQRLRDRGGDAQADELVECATSSSPEIIYAIVCTKNTRDGKMTIPFFSEVALRQRHQELQRLGIRCSYMLIEQESVRIAPAKKVA